MSRPAKSTRPEAMRPLRPGSRRIKARQATDLPAPLSPARPSTSPGSMLNDTSSTARNRFPAKWKSTERWLTESSAMSVPDLHALGEPVRQQPKTQRQRQDGRTWEEADPRILREISLTLGDHAAPFDRGRLDAKAKIVQRDRQHQR